MDSGGRDPARSGPPGQDDSSNSDTGRARDPIGASPRRDSSSGNGSQDSTKHLLDRFQRGDPHALSELFERLLPSLQRWAHFKLPPRLRRGNDTKDVVQDAFLRVLPHLDRFDYRQRRALRAYLRTAVHNRIRDELRRSDVREAATQRMGKPSGDQDGPFEALAEREAEMRYRSGLQRLSPEDRELIVARVELDYSYEKLALLSGRASQDAARMAVSRALKRFRKAMSEADPGGDE